MSSFQRRYEILLPRRFNDNSAVPDELFADVLLELRARFGAISTESQVIHGSWEHEDDVYRDELIRLFVDVDDSTENQQVFRGFKETLKERFKQIDIRMTTYLVEVY